VGEMMNMVAKVLQSDSLNWLFQNDVTVFFLIAKACAIVVSIS